MSEEPNQYEKEAENPDQDPSNPSEKGHRIRLSIDIHSLKDAEFRGLIYVRYSSLPQLGIKQFKTLPAIEVLKPTEEKFKNSFCSHTFDITKSKLYPQMTQTPLVLEVYHQDRLKKDILIGLSQVSLEELLKCPIRKTSNSYARVYDSYIPVDEIDENTRKPLKKIASLRVIIYLEDLGPSNGPMADENEDEFERKVASNENKKEFPVLLPDNNNNENDNNEEDADKKQIMEEMNSLEYKVVWELENWKKTEEMKFQMVLKQKELDFINKLSEDWKKKENEREKLWKRSEASINQIEAKLKGKASELQKREQKIVLLEEELKHKMNETIKIITNKDDEILELKKKIKDDRTLFEKERQISSIKTEEMKNKLNKLADEYAAFKKDQENSPITIVRNELNDKNREIKELKKEIEKVNQLKEEYKDYYDKMRNEIIKMKKAYETLKEDTNKQRNNEMEQLKLQIAALSMREDAKNIKGVREDLHQLKKKNFGSEISSERDEKEAHFSQNAISNPFKKAMFDNSNANENKENYSLMDNNHWNDASLSEIDRLAKEKQYLLQTGEYTKEDPLIIELDRQIKVLDKK